MPTQPSAMVDNANGLAQLELIRRRELSGQETDILQAFGLAIRPGVPSAAADAAGRLDGLCPPLESDQEARNYIWGVWEVLFYIAASADVPDQVHFSLVAVLHELKQKTRGKLEGDEVRTRVASLNGPDCSSTDSFLTQQRVWGDMYNIATCFDVHYRGEL